MKKILIVEDEPDILDIITLTLDMGDYELITASDGDHALELARREMPDLMLLDIMLLGEVDGLEVCRQLKGDEATEGIYIMIVTAKGMQRDLEAGFQAGCDRYIVKPFMVTRLLGEIEKVLG